MSDASDQTPPVDMDWLEEANDGDKEAMKAMVELYFSRVQTQIEELNSAIAAGDAAAVRRVAHACAGSSGTCGMTALEKQWRLLENMGRDGTLTEAPAVAGMVRQELERTTRFVVEKGVI